MKLHRVLLAGCMDCTRRHLPFGGNFCPPKLFFSSFSPLSTRLAGARTLVLCSARTVLYPLKYAMPLGDRKLGLYSRSCRDVGSNAAACSQTLPLSRCQPRGSQCAAVGKENLLQGGATWPGENYFITLLIK